MRAKKRLAISLVVFGIVYSWARADQMDEGEELEERVNVEAVLIERKGEDYRYKISIRNSLESGVLYVVEPNPQFGGVWLYADGERRRFAECDRMISEGGFTGVVLGPGEEFSIEIELEDRGDGVIDLKEAKQHLQIRRSDKLGFAIRLRISDFKEGKSSDTRRHLEVSVPDGMSLQFGQKSSDESGVDPDSAEFDPEKLPSIPD